MERASTLRKRIGLGLPVHLKLTPKQYVLVKYRSPDIVSIFTGKEIPVSDNASALDWFDFNHHCAYRVNVLDEDGVELTPHKNSLIDIGIPDSVGF